MITAIETALTRIDHVMKPSKAASCADVSIFPCSWLAILKPFRFQVIGAFCRKNDLNAIDSLPLAKSISYLDVGLSNSVASLNPIRFGSSASSSLGEETSITFS